MISSLNILLFVILLLSCTMSAWFSYKSFRRRQLNDQLAGELDNILQSTLETIKRNERIASKGGSPRGLGQSLPDLTSPTVLSSMLTVIVAKYGDMRLTLQDFMIPNEEYVSVYVDTSSSEIVLSTNHELPEGPVPTMVGFNDPDDNTFH
jgi:hypothetical protein